MAKSMLAIPVAILAGLAVSYSCREKDYTSTDKPDGAKTDPAKNYQTYCAGCHGVKMDEFVDRDWRHGSSLNDMIKGIRAGYPDEGMPGFAKALTDKEIKELAAYITEGIKNRNAYDFEDEPKSGTFKSDKLTIKLDTVVTGLAVPWGIAFFHDGSLLVTERGGRLYHVKNKKNTEIKGVPDVMAQGQGGLLDVVLHPDFDKNQLIYISYSKPKAGRATTAVMRARLNGFELSGQKVIFEALPYSSARHHYGSRLVFDKNNYLFISVGERGNENENPQNKDNDLGKIHRIKDDGSIPADNPFRDKDGKPTSLYCYGNRNPQGLVLHPVTGAIWETEHGPKGGDEINIIIPGANYGWPLTTYGIDYDGTIITDETTSPGIKEPLKYWVPSIAPSGNAFVTGDRYKPWKGALLTGSLRFQYLNLTYLDGTKVTREEKLLKNIGRVRDVRMGPDAYIYVAIENKDISVVRLVPVN